MGVRYKRNRRCRNCPETKEGLPVQQTASVTTYEGEGAELWKAGAVACGTLLELLFRYTVLNVPGTPLPQLERLHVRLGEIINLQKEREGERHESASPTD
jgi:hypothetical protein